MYDNIGEKIKRLAKGIFIGEAISLILTGIGLISSNPENETSIIIGVLLLIAGPLIAWVSSWITYGFGELIDKVTEIESNTRVYETKYREEKKNEEECEENEPKGNKSKNAPQNKSQKCVCGEIVYGDTCPNCGRNIQYTPKATTPPVSSNENIWHCEKCGQRMSKILSTCSACGASRPSGVQQSFTTSIPATSNEKMQKCVCGEKFYGNTCPNCGRTLK